MSAGRLTALHPVHRLIQSLGRDPAVRQRFGESPDDVFREFGLSDEEVAALKDGSIPALARIDVHPILRMHWLMMSNPDAAAHMSVAEYLLRFEAEARRG